MAPFALYALNQFSSAELCHCQSGHRYGECCQPNDFAEWRSDPVRQLRLALEFTQGLWFNCQTPPRAIWRFILDGTVPDLTQTYRLYREFIQSTERACVFKKRLLLSTASAGLTARSLSWKIAA